MEPSQIIETLNKTKQPTKDVIILKGAPGIYCFTLNNGSNLEEFATGETCIYIGISMNLSASQENSQLQSVPYVSPLRLVAFIYIHSLFKIASLRL